MGLVQEVRVFPATPFIPWVSLGHLNWARVEVTSGAGQVFSTLLEYGLKVLAALSAS